MSLYTDYVTMTNLMGRADDLSEVEVDRVAELAQLIIERSISLLAQITEVFDDNLDDGGTWEENEICVRVSNLLQRAGFFLDCPHHGVYARNKPQCPTCEGEQ